MASARKQIRDAVAAALKGKTAAADRVYVSKQYSVETLPAIGVTTPVDRNDLEQAAMGEERVHNLTVMVEIADQAVANVEDNLDAIATIVEQVLHGNGPLGAIVHEIELEETTTTFDLNSEQPLGVCVMTWTMEYEITRGDPENIIQ